MAEEQKIGGYQCEFVGPVPEDLVCNSCKLVAKNLYTTDCCGFERFCHVCVEQMLSDKKACSSCCESEFSTLFIKGAQRKVLALQVHCTLKQKGCEWVGQLLQLDAHLDTNCQYVDVECPSKCDQKVQKRNLSTHLKDYCPKREYRCPHCSFKATFDVVSNVHWLECSYYPLKCPNECGVTCERETMGEHKLLCSLEEIECELSYTGCKVKFLRQDQDEHMKKYAERHLGMIATAVSRISQDFDQKLQEKGIEMQQELQKKDDAMKQLVDSVNQESKKRDNELKRKLKEKDKQITAVEERFLKVLQERDEKHAAEVTALTEHFHEEIKILRMAAGVPPYLLIMNNYTTLITTDDDWYSEWFLSHPGGYKCELRVCPNGWGEGRGTHVSVGLISVPGEFDATLPWPAKATITLQLVNQHRSLGHWTIAKMFEWEKPSEGKEIGNFSTTFISHTRLEQAQYLKNGSLRFRITSVKLFK